MNNLTLADTLIIGMNNPDCAFYVGAVTASFLVLKIIFSLVLAYLALRILEKLIFTPLLNWIARKIYKK